MSAIARTAVRTAAPEPSSTEIPSNKPVGAIVYSLDGSGDESAATEDFRLRWIPDRRTFDEYSPQIEHIRFIVIDASHPRGIEVLSRFIHVRDLRMPFIVVDFQASMHDALIDESRVFCGIHLSDIVTTLRDCKDSDGTGVDPTISRRTRVTSRQEAPESDVTGFPSCDVVSIRSSHRIHHAADGPEPLASRPHQSFRRFLHTDQSNGVQHGSTDLAKSEVCDAPIENSVDRSQNAEAKLSALSERETQVLALVVDGLTNKMIGARLFISVRTVEKHRCNLIRKLKTRSVAELTRLWLAAES